MDCKHARTDGGFGHFEGGGWRWAAGSGSGGHAAHAPSHLTPGPGRTKYERRRWMCVLQHISHATPPSTHTFRFVVLVEDDIHFSSIQHKHTSFSENHTKRIEAICLKEIQQDMSRRTNQHRTIAHITTQQASQGTHAIVGSSDTVVNPPWSNSPVDVKWGWMKIS